MLAVPPVFVTVRPLKPAPFAVIVGEVTPVSDAVPPFAAKPCSVTLPPKPVDTLDAVRLPTSKLPVKDCVPLEAVIVPALAAVAFVAAPESHQAAA